MNPRRELPMYGYQGPCPRCGYYEPNGCGDLHCPRRYPPGGAPCRVRRDDETSTPHQTD